MSKLVTFVEITEFSEHLQSRPKPGPRAKARIYCEHCQRHHHLHWGEFKNALKSGAVSLQGIIDAYSWKYCRDRDTGGEV